jgi:hypothetical protein
MFNVDETYVDLKCYKSQRDIPLKFLCYSTSVIVFVDILREEVPEINILQLVPGYYLLLIFVSLIFLISFSLYFNQIPIFLETARDFGIRSSNRPTLYRIGNSSTLFLFSLFIFGYNTIIPTSLDSFSSYGEKNLESLWTFAQALGIEVALFLFLVILSQTPIGGLYGLRTEMDVLSLPAIWRYITILSITISGFLTPTIDGLTQISFAIVSIFLYLLVLLILEKRNTLKLSGTSVLGG